MPFKRYSLGLAALVITALTAIGSPGLAANIGANPGISQKVAPCDWAYPTRCQKVNADGSVNVSGSITASLGAFNPVASTTLAVSNVSARVAFPSADTSVLIRNTSTADAYLVFGSGSVVATTGTGTLLPAGQAVAYSVGATTNVAAITASGTTSLAITTGTGLPALTGGGGGSGGGGAITAASGAIASGAYASGSIASGAIASGAYSSGSVASGAFAAGAIVDLGTGASPAANTANAWLKALNNAQGATTSGETGPLILGAVTTSAPTYTTAQSSPLSLDTTGALRVNVTAGGAGGGAVTVASNADVTEGATTDTTCTATHTVSGCLYQLNLNTTAAIPAGSAIIGKVGIDQTTPGTTNGTQDAATSATGSAVSSKAIYAGAVSSGNLTGIIQADSSAAINVSTATTTQIVALASAKKIYVTSLDVIAGGTGNIAFVYGTGSNCGTGTTSLTGAYNLTAQAGIAKGNGLGAVLVVPASNALCVTTSAAVQMSGAVSYTQF